MESTHARTGRLTKMSASMKVLLLKGEPVAFATGEKCGSGLQRDLAPGRRSVTLLALRVRHVDQVRLDGQARPDLLQAGNDHPLARFQSVGDLAQAVVERARA